MGHVDAGASRPLHEPRWQGILVWVMKVPGISVWVIKVPGDISVGYESPRDISVGYKSPRDISVGYESPREQGAMGGATPHKGLKAVSYTHLRAHETLRYLVCRLLLEKKK